MRAASDRRARTCALALFAALHAPAAEAYAQLRPEPGITREARDTAALPSLRQPSPFLGSDHWAVEAVRRLHAVGLVPQTLEPAAARTPRLVEVAGAFAFAMHNAADEQTRILAGRWLQLLQREAGLTPFTDDAAQADYGGQPFAHGAAVAGAELADGLAGTGTGYDEDPLNRWTGTVPLADEENSLIGLRALGAFGSRLGFRADVMAQDADAVDVRSAHVVVDAGFVGFWAGRREVAFGPGWSGTIALADGQAFTGIGMYFADGARLPWILHWLGPIRFEGFVSRVENGDGAGVTDPFFGAARLSSNLHPRFAMGATRAVMFGGRNAAPFTWTRFRQMLLGDPSFERGGAWSNQVFAWDMRWRPPIGSLPLLLYSELGFDDASGAYWRSPAAILGAGIGMVPGLPQLGFGVEWIYFSDASSKNPIWYRNYALTGGWTHERRPLGHPIGGHGKGWYAHASLDALESRLRMDAAAFLYDRGSENLFAPERIGRAVGGSLDLAWRLAPRLEMNTGATLEDGAGWRETTAVLRLHYIF